MPSGVVVPLRGGAPATAALIEDFARRYGNRSTRHQYVVELTDLFQRSRRDHPHLLTEADVLAWAATTPPRAHAERFGIPPCSTGAVSGRVKLMSLTVIGVLLLAYVESAYVPNAPGIGLLVAAITDSQSVLSARRPRSSRSAAMLGARWSPEPFG